MPGKSIKKQREEVWMVKLTSKVEYFLNKKQADILIQAILDKEKAVIFNEFLIPIPYVVDFYKLPFKSKVKLGFQDKRTWEEKEVDRLLE